MGKWSHETERHFVRDDDADWQHGLGSDVYRRALDCTGATSERAGAQRAS